MGYRINERNIGNWTLDGEPKRRRQSKKLTDEEKEIAKGILFKVYECLEYDKDLSDRGHLHPDAKFTDGGRFTLMVTGNELNVLENLIFKKL